MGVVYILIDMKTNDPLGDLIDNLIDVYVDNKTPKGVTKQLEPIINGLVELLQGEHKGSPLLDTKMLMEMYYTEQFIKAMERGEIAQAKRIEIGDWVRIRKTGIDGMYQVVGWR